MIEVSINSRFPVFIKADADTFGKAFATMDGGEQVAVLRAMVEHMRPHKLQWDYIAIELGKPENKETAKELFDCLQFALTEDLS